MADEERHVGIATQPQIGAERLARVVIKEDHALAPALAGDQRLLGVTVVDVAAIESCHFGATHARAIEHLQQGAIAREAQPRLVTGVGWNQRRELVLDIINNDRQRVVNPRRAVARRGPHAVETLDRTLQRERGQRPLTQAMPQEGASGGHVGRNGRFALRPQLVGKREIKALQGAVVDGVKCELVLTGGLPRPTREPAQPRGVRRSRAR